MWRLKSYRPPKRGLGKSASSRFKRPSSHWLQRLKWPALKFFGISCCLFAILYPPYQLYANGNIGKAYLFVESQFVALTQKQGLAVEEILVDGRNFTSKEELLGTLDIDRGTAILGIDLQKAQNRLLALPWIKSATVERRLPDTILVRLTERRPIALWQNKGAITLIDERGAVILDQDINKFSGLILLIGSDAPSHAPELLKVLSSIPDLGQKVTSATRIGARRWDIKLFNSIIVKLPEDGAEQAWQRLSELQKNAKILEQNIVSIDLRLPDRLYIESQPSENPGVSIPDAPGKNT